MKIKDTDIYITNDNKHSKCPSISEITNRAQNLRKYLWQPSWLNSKNWMKEIRNYEKKKQIKARKNWLEEFWEDSFDSTDTIKVF